ncbi:hypothetical protein [Labrys monachus]|uniref:Uncharacterized protein n=1 Tax=Labrys monachus TaxID=217067 RepID=A0ABU0FLN4_9HYPH|nr:hypothetical protein [Labrys monachus]MDQ0395421.1 hypothetical protein [Labrys monachus]
MFAKQIAGARADAPTSGFASPQAETQLHQKSRFRRNTAYRKPQPGARFFNVTSAPGPATAGNLSPPAPRLCRIGFAEVAYFDPQYLKPVLSRAGFFVSLGPGGRAAATIGVEPPSEAESGPNSANLLVFPVYPP